jgi:hypothetical protein
MDEMPPSVRTRYERYLDAPVTWDSVAGGKLPFISWRDEVEEDLGPDPDGRRFAEICRRIMGGHYYPHDTIEFFGPWMSDEPGGIAARRIAVGDRILQRARLIPFLPWPAVWAMTEVFVAECSDSMCTLGYVTTRRHFGRGVWQSKVTRESDRIRVRVTSISAPQSWLFWAALPIARHLQKRAWRRAIEEFRAIT